MRLLVQWAMMTLFVMALVGALLGVLYSLPLLIEFGIRLAGRHGIILVTVVSVFLFSAGISAVVVIGEDW